MHKRGFPHLPRERLSETILQTVKLDAMICPFRGNAERAFCI